MGLVAVGSRDKCAREGSRSRRVPITAVCGGRVGDQDVWEAAGWVSPGGYQPTSLSSMVSPSLGL